VLCHLACCAAVSARGQKAASCELRSWMCDLRAASCELQAKTLGPKTARTAHSLRRYTQSSELETVCSAQCRTVRAFICALECEECRAGKWPPLFRPLWEPLLETGDSYARHFAQNRRPCAISRSPASSGAPSSEQGGGPARGGGRAAEAPTDGVWQRAWATPGGPNCSLDR